MLENSEILLIREKQRKTNKIFRKFEQKKIQLYIQKKENSKIRNCKTFNETDKTDNDRRDNGICCKFDDDVDK
jgi:hypothetical protein